MKILPAATIPLRPGGVEFFFFLPATAEFLE